jgi:hypothetical protein
VGLCQLALARIGLEARLDPRQRAHSTSCVAAMTLISTNWQTYLVRGVWLPSHFAAGGNRLYLDYWDITGDLVPGV